MAPGFSVKGEGIFQPHLNFPQASELHTGQALTLCSPSLLPYNKHGSIRAGIRLPSRNPTAGSSKGWVNIINTTRSLTGLGSISFVLPV